jgi:DNA-binding winged helix-turn-helix (wHTH) protein/Flp pilus assembly protein TadD
MVRFMKSIVWAKYAGRPQSGLIQDRSLVKVAEEIAFDRYRVDRKRRQLLRDGKPVSLNGKAFDMLLAFAESDGSVLTREELYARLWPASIVEEANLSQTVYLLRRALDPAGDGRGFIETIPRFGYRFAKPVHVISRAPARPRRAIAWIALMLPAILLSAAALGTVQPHRAPVSTAASNEDALGRYHLDLRTPNHLEYALAYFKEAERDAPADAFGYAGAAEAYALLAEYQPERTARRRALVSLAEASRDIALLRDPDSARALAVAGFIAYRFNNNRFAADRDLDRAIAGDPNDAQAHHWRGVVLVTEGKLTAALAEFQEAHRLEPTSEVYSRWLARAYLFTRHAGDAIAEAQQTLRIEPDDAPAWLTIAGAQELRGDLEHAVQTLLALQRRDPSERPYVIPDVARLEARLRVANRVALIRHIDELAAGGRLDPFEAALFYLTVGRKNQAMNMLRIESRSVVAAEIQRNDPRLSALM